MVKLDLQVPMLVNIGMKFFSCSGQELIYNVVATSQKEIIKKRKRLQQLEAQLMPTGKSKEEMLLDGRKLSAENTLALFRTRIINTFLAIEQQKLDISHLAGFFLLTCLCTFACHVFLIVLLII